VHAHAPAIAYDAKTLRAYSAFVEGRISTIVFDIRHVFQYQSNVCTCVIMKCVIHSSVDSALPVPVHYGTGTKNASVIHGHLRAVRGPAPTAERWRRPALFKKDRLLLAGRSGGEGRGRPARSPVQSTGLYS
jgi:hypothetical protein